MDPFYLGAYWGSRQESSEHCAERLATCLVRLGEIDRSLAVWFRRGASKAAAKIPIDLDALSLNRLLSQGVNRRDVGGEVIEDLGFSFGLWNRNRPTVGLGGTVGAHPSFGGVLNGIVLDIPPPDDDAAARLFVPAVATAIFDAVVEAWMPDWATWTSHPLRKVQGAAPREPVIGWMTYVASPLTVQLPNARRRSLLNGMVIELTGQIGGLSEADVLAARSSLVDAGALVPIP